MKHFGIKQLLNPIPMGLIFDYCLWGGIGCPPSLLKSALIELEKFEDSFGKPSKNHGGYHIVVIDTFMCK